ncbi:hypothetical protein M427DRAFT_70184 [Gonapodya prolifera JEL478]|uniref:Uncharacterized protein n=1 Tax=Gonapodya prolifera (strain JEL478) TaxID=1344416 RepID=A0A139AEI3_GONPJ|nr:hypothetical protein M427DRAFT_70184 [Gonapodya prolifera JEL478]|eukprot:KXS15089.1 hypothetical protein M427DRAFT_70184 [Gonapodya prolifera JEL478]
MKGLANPSTNAGASGVRDFASPAQPPSKQAYTPDKLASKEASVSRGASRRSLGSLKDANMRAKKPKRARPRKTIAELAADLDLTEQLLGEQNLARARIKELEEEIKTLKATTRIQDRALSTFRDQQTSFPSLLQALHADLRSTKHAHSNLLVKLRDEERRSAGLVAEVVRLRQICEAYGRDPSTGAPRPKVDSHVHERNGQDATPAEAQTADLRARTLEKELDAARREIARVVDERARLRDQLVRSRREREEAERRAKNAEHLVAHEPTSPQPNGISFIKSGVASSPTPRNNTTPISRSRRITASDPAPRSRSVSKSRQTTIISHKKAVEARALPTVPEKSATPSRSAAVSPHPTSVSAHPASVSPPPPSVSPQTPIATPEPRVAPRALSPPPPPANVSRARSPVVAPSARSPNQEQIAVAPTSPPSQTRFIGTHDTTAPSTVFKPNLFAKPSAASAVGGGQTLKPHYPPVEVSPVYADVGTSDGKEPAPLGTKPHTSAALLKGSHRTPATSGYVPSTSPSRPNKGGRSVQIGLPARGAPADEETFEEVEIESL